MVGEFVGGVLIVLRRLQQRFGRNAADIGAGPSERRLAVRRLPVVDARGFEPQLRRTNRGNVATRAATDYDNIEFLSHIYFPSAALSVS